LREGSLRLRDGWAGRDPFGKEAQKTMTPDNFATQSLPPRDQLEAWREWHRPVLDFLPQQSTRYGFLAEVHLWKLGGLGDEPYLGASRWCRTNEEKPQTLSIIGSSATASGARIS
jgi:hypothetical protein